MKGFLITGEVLSYIGVFAGGMCVAQRQVELGLALIAVGAFLGVLITVLKQRRREAEYQKEREQ